jgi:plasmid maintenance system antidote protein VapI
MNIKNNMRPIHPGEILRLVADRLLTLLPENGITLSTF